MSFYYVLLYFFVYGFLGWCTEVAFAAVKDHKFVNRGFLNGPICPIYGVGVCSVIVLLTPFKNNLFPLYILSVILVTVIEGLTGLAMDLIFHNKWWDYSDQPFNIGGYVCLTFSLIWGVACVVIMKFIHPLIHGLLTFIPHTFGIVLIIILGIAMLADLYMTASAIFKFNRHLEGMEKIARELHEFSEQLGNDISEKVLGALEKQELSKEWFDNAAADIREYKMETAEEMHYRLEELKKRYSKINDELPKNSLRLVTAFPKMESRKYKIQLEAFKKFCVNIRADKKRRSRH